VKRAHALLATLVAADLAAATSSAGAPAAAALELETLRAATRRLGADAWTARPPTPEILAAARAGGAAAEPEEPFRSVAKRALDHRAEGAAAAADLPPAFDWRARPEGAFLPPVPPTQGRCGACVAFALAAAAEAALDRACATSTPSFDLSRQFLFSCGGGTCRGGWQLSAATAFLGDHGVPDTPCLPYAAADGHDVACAAACGDVGDRSFRGFVVTRPTTGWVDVAAVKTALLRGPLVSSLILFEDLAYYGGGVYRHVQGNQIGSHAILLLGWRDEDRAWIARNSWGPDWGEHGDFEVAWDDVSLPGRYTFAIDAEDAARSGACVRPR
jgi:C1A family cysteine protease